jgi:predicted metal-dependent hydrolase
MDEPIPMLDRDWEGVDLYNQGRYMESFHVFEESWRGSQGEKRSYFQGLLNLCGGMLKITVDGNQEGAVGLLGSSLQMLRAVDPDRVEIDLKKLLDEAEYCLDQVKLHNPAALTLFDREILPKIHRKSG